MNERLRAVLSRALGLPPEAIRSELERDAVPAWDSQGHMELVLALEESFGLDLEMAEVIALKRVADIERLIAERAGSAAG